MNFLKENVFLTVTVVVVIVGVSLATVLKHSSDSEADKYAAECAKLGEKLSSLAKAGINEDKKASARRNDKRVDIEAEAVRDDFLRRSRSGYQVMKFKLGENEVAAFPVELFEDRQRLLLLVRDQYSQQVTSLLKSLKPTVPPGIKEIEQKADEIRAQELPVEKTNEGDKPASPPGNRPLEHIRRTERPSEHRTGRPSEFRPSEVRRTIPGRPSDMERGSDLTGADGEPTPDERARKDLVLRNSERGWIYADADSIREATISQNVHYDDKLLYLKQAGLWVLQDIVEVINQTNRQVRSESAAKGKKGVSASAVKRLMDIKVRGYVLGQGASGAGAGRAGDVGFGPPAAGQAPTEVALQYLDLSGGSSPLEVPRLTQHACNQLYDVVHYEFTVVMPTRHLVRLQKNLSTHNFHTVLLFTVGPPSSRTGRKDQESAKSQQRDDLFYYGPDPVRQVTITGQLLLLAEWTRGRWDPKAKKWDEKYPALMPVEFLVEMNKIDPGALRPEDIKRLPVKETPAPGDLYGSGLGPS